MQNRIPYPFFVILEVIFRSFVLPFIFTCWSCLDKLLRINFPSAFFLFFLNCQVRSHHMHLKGALLMGHPAPLSLPMHVLTPAGSQWRDLSDSAAKRTSVSQPSSIIILPCQDQAQYTTVFLKNKECAFQCNIFPGLIV